MKLILATLLVAGLAMRAGANEYDCVIDPAVIVEVGSSVTGLIEDVFIERGQKVERGQVIAQLKDDMEDASIALIELQAASVEEIAASQVRLDLAKSRQTRVAELSERGVATGEQLDEINAAVGVATRELRLAEMRQGVLEKELERARIEQGLRIIRSPVNGIVVSRNLFRGEFLSQDTHLAVIAQIDPLFVETFLPVSAFPDLKLGQMATVLPNEPVGGVYDAEIVVIDTVFDVASGTFGVRLALPNPDQSLPAGHRCKVDFGGGDG